MKETQPLTDQQPLDPADPDQLSHYRQVLNKNGEPVMVPVIDVRDGVAHRALARQIERANNQSRFIRYTRYHQSPKKQTLQP